MQDEAADAGIKKFGYVRRLKKAATGLEDREHSCGNDRIETLGYLKTDGMMELLKLMDFDANGIVSDMGFCNKQIRL